MLGGDVDVYVDYTPNDDTSRKSYFRGEVRIDNVDFMVALLGVEDWRDLAASFARTVRDMARENGGLSTPQTGICGIMLGDGEGVTVTLYVYEIGGYVVVGDRVSYITNSKGEP
jgi:hypothetical protein